MDERSDEQLLEAWRGGDRSAGAELFERHYEGVERFFSYKLGPQNEDLIQATFLGLLEGIERLEAMGSFRAFLFGIARNKLLNHLRNVCRDRERFEPGKSSLLEATDTSATAALAARGRNKLLVSALLRLPLDTQIMFELHYWEQLKLREIAAAFDMPLNTVKARMRRGRQELAESIRELAESPAQLETTLGGLETWAVRLRAELDHPA